MSALSRASITMSHSPCVLFNSITETELGRQIREHWHTFTYSRRAARTALLALPPLLAKARAQHESNQAFGQWASEHIPAINHSDRAALINLGQHWETGALGFVEQSESVSPQLLWRDFRAVFIEYEDDVGPPLCPGNGNDCVQTPDDLADRIVKRFLPQIKPSDTILEPCRGNGAFIRAFAKHGLINVDWCEINDGRDFLDYDKEVDWIITNPPWSKIREFLQHSYRIATNGVWLTPSNHVTTLTARTEDMEEAGWGIKEVPRLRRIDTPLQPWPQSGFLLAAVHLQRGWVSDTFTWL